MSLFEVGAELERSVNADCAWRKATEGLARAGFPFVVYLSANADRSRVDVRTTMKGLYDGLDARRDPFLEYCCGGYEVTRMGIDYLPGRDFLSERERAIIARASELGYRSGFGIPMRLEGSDRFGGFILGTSLGRDCFEAQHAGDVDTLRAFCLILHRRLEDLGAENLPDDLSPREIEVARLIADGHTRKEIARRLELSPNTVAEYTRAVYRKLGVSNRVEATKAVLAARRGAA